MKYLFTISILCFCFYGMKGQVTWQKRYGYSDGNTFNSLQKTFDGGYIVGATTAYCGSGIEDAYLIKINSLGDTLWSRTYGDTGVDAGSLVLQAIDSGYILCGYKNIYGSGDQDIFLIKTTTYGDTLWSRTYGGIADEEPFSIIQTSDTGYLIVSHSNSFGTGNLYLIKTNYLGDTLWTKFLNSPGTYGYFLQNSLDGNIFLLGSGTVNSFSGIFLIKLDLNGNVIWTHGYSGTPIIPSGGVFTQTSDSGFIIAGGISRTLFNGPGDILLIRTNSYGDTLWTKEFGRYAIFQPENSWVRSIEQTADSGFIISGETRISGSSYVYLVKTTSNGDILWSKLYGYSIGQSGFSAHQTSDGGFIICANDFQPSGFTYIYIIKTDSMGNSGCNLYSDSTTFTDPHIFIDSVSITLSNAFTLVTVPVTKVGYGCAITPLCSSVNINSPNSSNKFLLSPNPTSEKININTYFPNIQSIEIFNLFGVKIFGALAANWQQLTVNCEAFPPGIYFVRIQTENGTAVQKLIKE